MWEEETLYVNILFLLVKVSRCWLLPATSHYCQHQCETTHLSKQGSRRRVSIAPGKGVETKKFVHFDFNYIINVISIYVYGNKKVCLLFNNKQQFKCNRRYTAKSTSHDQECRWSTWDTQEGYSMLVSRYARLKPLHERSFSSPNTTLGSVTYYTDSFQQRWIITGDGPLIIITTQVK